MLIRFDDYVIREFEEGDIATLVRYADNPRIATNLRDRFPVPYREDDARAWLSAVATEDPTLNFAIATPEEQIGAIGLILQEDVYRCSAEIGYWLAEPFWGKGIITGAVRVFSDFAFEHFRLNRLYAGVFATNRASARVLEKAGYRYEGCARKAIVKDGRLIDQLNYAIVREDFNPVRGNSGE